MSLAALSKLMSVSNSILIVLLPFSETESIFYTLCLGVGKEVVDAIVPWEKYGSWGGDGFSKYDLYYDILGIGIGYMVDKLWKPKENSKWERRFNTNSLSISYRLYSK